ncbi:MAG: response regulator transcription factor [Sphingomonadales bacterium]|nr:response regulator transcription factor [Sphingomonadales bacterium]
MGDGRVLLADDHPLIREGLTLAIAARHPSVLVDSVESVAAAEVMARTHKDYRLMLLDYQLPDADGYSGFFRMLHALGRTPIAIISAHDHPSMISAAKAIGAAGFLSKSEPLDQLASAIDQLLQGKAVFPPVPAVGDELIALRKRLETLSPAQMRVLAALAKGHLNKQIAADLDLTEATIKAHMTAVFRKLGVSNRVQALLAVRPLFDPET